MRSKMSRKITLSFVLALFLLFAWFSMPGTMGSTSTSSSKTSSEAGGITNVILIGATGDLSRRYLWQGFFNLLNEEYKQVFNLYAGARMDREAGEREMNIILAENVSCSRLPPPVFQRISNCEEVKSSFAASVSYYQLKKADDYKVLCGDIQQKIHRSGLRERGRIFYLAVPAFAYASMADSINQECRPGGDAWLRVVVEKPFGHDTQSARELSSALTQHLRESEIYRIDHYLGKTGVQSILPFRAMNKATFGGMWNRDNVEKVEIVMKEALDVKGRIGFYDKYGVIRDVMQNHLTEIMTLVAMEMPANLSSVHDYRREKLALLNQIDPLTPQQAVIGQYEGYSAEWRQEMKSADEMTNTPTFAGVLLTISNPHWSNVPFVMVAGKKLDHKLVYVRIVFKSNEFCTFTPNYNDGDHACKPKQLIFFIGSAKHPTIAVSKSLPKPELPSHWLIPDLGEDADILGYPLKDFHYYSASSESDAYSTLIRECYHGNHDKFIGTSDLMALWDVWTPLLHGLRDVQPRLYTGGTENRRWLDFKITGKKLSYVHKLDEEWNVDNSLKFGIPSISGISSTFRSQPLFTGSTEDTVTFLAMHLSVNANQAIRQRGSFHIAFPGGNTPEHLFIYLALRMRHTFPWHDTHIWFADERCVPLTNENSNFNLVYSRLLQYTTVPYTNIHAMPVQLVNGLCNSQDNGTDIYAAEIRRSVPDLRFDYILLGVGADGHVASLFPNHPTLSESGRLVILSDGGPSTGVRKRMSLGYAAINTARNVAVQILGESKRKIVEILKQEHKTDSQKWPVLGVKLSNGNMTWFIDHDALL